MFDEAFLDDLPSNPYEAAQIMCERFKEVHKRIPSEEEANNFDQYLQAFAVMGALIDAIGLKFKLPELSEPPKPKDDVDLIKEFFYELGPRISVKKHESTTPKYREKFVGMFGTAFIYQFSDGDITRIQELLNELRDKIIESELFDAKHQQRILNKLEKLQSELHKKMSNLDGFWGLIGEGGVVLGKFGKDAKPLVDRIREIAQIVWRTQARAAELPSGTTLPLLSEGK